MPRPPLVLGTWGRINVTGSKDRGYTAYARYRDYDGETRQVERRGRTKTIAENTLLEALRDRARLDSDDITPDTPLRVVAERWFEQFVDEQKAENTVIAYRRAVFDIIIPSIGGLRIRELSVARLDRFMQTVARTRGPATAKGVKSCLSGIVSLAARHGAIDRNPLRDVATIKRPVREIVALELDQLIDLRRKMYADEFAKLQDLVEPIDYILATGVRPGEALALRWHDLNIDVDLDAGEIGTARVTATIVRGRLQEHPKTPSGQRALKLPSWIVIMLRARREQMPANSLGLVFASTAGTVRDLGNLRRSWRGLRERIGYDWVTPKTFRKTIATLVDDPEVAAKQLGHADSRTTKLHYIKPTHEGPDIRAILDQIVAEPAFTQRVRASRPRSTHHNPSASESETA